MDSYSTPYRDSVSRCQGLIFGIDVSRGLLYSRADLVNRCISGFWAEQTFTMATYGKN